MSTLSYIRAVILFIALTLFSFIPAFGADSTERPKDAPAKSIILITSFNTQISWTKEFLDGFLPKMTQSNVNVSILDLSISTNPSLAAREEDEHWILTRMSEAKYSGIVALDLPAIALVKRVFDKLPKDIKIMLAGDMGDENIEFATNNSNVFTIEKHLAFEENMRLGFKLFPDAKRVNIVTGSPIEGRIANQVMKAEFEKMKRSDPDFAESIKDVDIDFINGKDYSTQEMLARCAKAPGFTLYFRWVTEKDPAGARQDLLIDNLLSATEGNVLVFLGTFNEDVIGGYVVNGVKYGFFTADLITEISKGSWDSRVFKFSFPNELNINTGAFIQNDLDYSVLPPETNFYNTPPKFWETLDLRIVVLVLLVFLLLVIAVLVLTYRSSIEAKKNAILFKNLPLNVYVFGIDGQILHQSIESGHAKDPENASKFTEKFHHILSANSEKIRTHGRLSIEYDFGSDKRRKAEVAKLPKNVFGKDTFIATSLDISELELTKRKAEETSLYLQTTLNSIGDAVIATDENEIITFINPIAAELTAYTPEEAIGMHLNDVFKIVSYIDGSVVASPITKAIRTREIVTLANHTDLIAKDGKRYHIADSAAPIFHKGKLTGAILVFRDVTESYKKRDALVFNNTLLKTVAEMANVSYLMCDKDLNAVGDNTDSQDAIAMIQAADYKRFVAPEDLPAYENAIAKLNSGESDYENFSFRADLPEGTKYYSASAQLQGDRPEDKKILIVFHDITELKESENNLRKNAAFQKNLLDNIPCAIFVKDNDAGARYVLANNHLTNSIGYAGGNMEGRRPMDIFDEETVNFLEATDKAALSNMGETSEHIGEIRLKSGLSLKVQIIKTAVKLEDGHTYIFCAWLEISDMLRMQDEIKVINECLRCSLSADTLEETYNEILKTIANTLKPDRAFIYKYDEDNDKFDHLITRGDNSDEPRLNAFLASAELGALISKTFKGNKNTVICDLECFTQEQKDFLMIELGVTGYMIAGVYDGDKLWGFIAVDRIVNKTRFSKNDIRLFTSITGIADTVVEKYRNVDIIQAAERHRRMILDSINIPVILFDKNKKIVLANEAAERAYKVSLEMMTSKPCYESLCRDKNFPNCIVGKTLVTKKAESMELEVDGRSFIVETSPITDESGALAYVLESFVDVTEQNESKHKLEEAMLIAQRADRAKSFFIATMSHELRTPLNAVIGYSELTQNPSLTQNERVHNLKNIRFAANALLSLVNDILDLSRLEAGQIEIVKAPLDIAEMLREFKDVFKFAVRNKGINFVLNVPDRVPLYKMDLLRLKQIFMNIIGNAVKFTNKGCVTVDLEMLSNSEDARDIRVSIRDTGIGISKNFIEKIFNPFEIDTTNRARGNIYEGTGLGLSIAKRLMEEMGGKIEVQSEENVGTCFTLTFRGLDIADDREVTQYAENVATQQENFDIVSHKRDITVLIVDDIKINLKVLGKMLNLVGAMPIDALSGEEALEKLGESKPDVIMTDLWMPKMSGDEFARIVRTNHEYDGIPIIAVTADTQISDPDHIFDAILMKPISAKSISDSLNKVLSKNKHS